MLQIIWLILKIIGIVLLSVIGLILLGIVLVLFVPARYRIQASWHGEAVVKIKMSWLLHIISISIEYLDNELIKKFKIFGFQYKKRDKAEKTTRHKKNKNKTTELLTETDDNIVYEEISSELADRIEITDTQNVSDTSADGMNESNPTESFDACKEHKDDIDDTNLSIFDRIKKFIHAIFDGLKNIRYTIKEFYDKLIHIKDNIEYYLELLQDEHNQDAFKLCMGQLFEILSHIKPRRFRADLIIGTDDPATTGTILAVLGVIYPLFEGNLHVTPDFEKSVFDLELFAKGRIRAIVMLRVAWRLYFNQDIKRLIGTIKGGSMND